MDERKKPALQEKARADKIPFNQNFINLHFRKAFVDHEAGNYDENPFERELRNLRKRFKRDLSQVEQYYWDVLYSVNKRGYSLDQILQDVAMIDPDKEAWIKSQITDPKGIFRNKVEYFYRKDL